MEEKNNGEKKVIKISLTTTIIIAIIVMCLTITATYAFFRLTNKTIHEENKNNLVDNIEEDIAIAGIPAKKVSNNGCKVCILLISIIIKHN